MGEATLPPKPGVVEAQPLRSRTVGVESGRRGRRRRRRRHRFRTPHLAMVRTEVGRANPTRHPGIRTGTTHKVHRAGPAVPRARSRAIFSLATLRNKRKSFPPPSRHVVIVPLPVPSASHRVALPDSLRKPDCMRNALCIFAKAQEWDLSIWMQTFRLRIFHDAVFNYTTNDFR